MDLLGECGYLKFLQSIRQCALIIYQILFMIWVRFRGSTCSYTAPYCSALYPVLSKTPFLRLAFIYHSWPRFCAARTLSLDFVCSAQMLWWWSWCYGGPWEVAQWADGRMDGWGAHPAQLNRFNCCINISLKLAHCAPGWRWVQAQIQTPLCGRLWYDQIRTSFFVEKQSITTYLSIINIRPKGEVPEPRFVSHSSQSFKQIIIKWIEIVCEVFAYSIATCN